MGGWVVEVCGGAVCRRGLLSGVRDSGGLFHWDVGMCFPGSDRGKSERLVLRAVYGVDRSYEHDPWYTGYSYLFSSKQMQSTCSAIDATQ